MKNKSLLLFALTLCSAFSFAQEQQAKPEVSRTQDYLAKFVSSNKAAVENSLIFDNGSNVGVSTATPVALFDVNGSVNASSYNLDEQPFAIGSYTNQNAFFGFSGNTSLTGIDNTAVGYLALPAVTSGDYNDAFGVQALQADTAGHSNAAFGLLALVANNTGNYNAAQGNRSLEGNTTGSYNTAIGYFSEVSNTTGNFNVGVGFNSALTVDGSPETGSNNTELGTGAELSTGSLNYATAVGSNALVSASNALILGCVAGVNNCTTTTSVGIATSTPESGYTLTIGKGYGDAIADGWKTYSSRRWKTNIQTLQGSLDKVEQLRGVSYDLTTNGTHQIGVIAEEVGAVVPEVVSWEKNGKDASGVDYSRLTALLIEAVKEQQAEIESLTHQLNTIQTTLQQNGQHDSTILSASASVPSIH